MGMDADKRHDIYIRLENFIDWIDEHHNSASFVLDGETIRLDSGEMGSLLDEYIQCLEAPDGE